MLRRNCLVFAPRPYLWGLHERRALNSNLPAITVYGDEASSLALPLSLILRVSVLPHLSSFFIALPSVLNYFSLLLSSLSPPPPPLSTFLPSAGPVDPHWSASERADLISDAVCHAASALKGSGSHGITTLLCPHHLSSHPSFHLTDGSVPPLIFPCTPSIRSFRSSRL